VLRELFRNLQAFRAVFEAEGVETLSGPDGQVWNLWDLEYLYEQIVFLPPRQRQAIQLCLFANIKETDAAVMMGVSPTNPVSMYAASGIRKLIIMIQEGKFPRFQLIDQNGQDGLQQQEVG